MRAWLLLTWPIALFFCAATSASAQTGPSPDRDHETHVTARVGPASFGAEERQEGRLLNREQGTLVRTSLGLSHAGGVWVVRTAFRESRGTVDYTGHTQFGLPLLTKTAWARHEFAATGTYRWPLLHQSSIEATGGAEIVRHARDIRPTVLSTQLTETMTSRLWVIGAGGRTAFTVAGRPLRLVGALAVLRPWSQRLSVDTHGLTDAITLDPRFRWSQRLDIDATWPASDSLLVGISAGHEMLRAGTSAAVTAYRDGLPAGSVSYPGSVQRTRHVGVMAAWRF